MTSRRAVTCIIAGIAAAGCQSRPSTAPSPSAPPPRVAIRADVTGLNVHREVGAVFASQQDAYVLVGHVSGDGRLHVLFPANAKQSALIHAGTRYEIMPFPADVDADLSLFSLTRPPERSAGARLDSYDGQGSAFLFIIASAKPLAYDDIANDDGSFDSYLLPTYWYETDPRAEIDQFAREVAGGARYRIEYAYGFSSVRYSSLSDRMLDCAAWEFSARDPVTGAGGGQPLLWNWFGSDLGFWNLDDPYAGMYGCNRGAAFPGAYAVSTVPAPPPEKDYAHLRVLHRPLVSGSAMAERQRDGDRFPHRDRGAMSTSRPAPQPRPRTPASEGPRPQAPPPSARPAPSPHPAPARQPPSRPPSHQQ